ncbi:hypothetical protein BDW02DRAFT_492814 [Decorospora gaudefroyi]|uniref:Peptidase S54 rhomboid domain-containing protein n=1 Tax=Decorospora gaudefroyi TaxID=184978 RepID=A0A6A5KNF3_9PLEO|nr:hypothetical protein BDW02DRAFT_492814 [Decorospora gaudefroyi]
MSVFKAGGPPLRLACLASRTPAVATPRPTLRGLSQTRAQYYHRQNRTPTSFRQQSPTSQKASLLLGRVVDYVGPKVSRKTHTLNQPPRIKVYYLRPAIWALLVSSGIYIGLAYLEAERELKPKSMFEGRFQAPQWSPPNRGPPTPTEVVTGAWRSLDPISQTTYGIIATNAAVHLSSFVVPRFWDTLWHLPARNVNYTQFTSMFVHSGALHIFANMYFLNNFMRPVGYSPLFEGSPYHILAFFLSTGVLSGFAQHWSTLISIQKRPIAEVLIRCGGASGALFGVLGVFCVQYPHAGLGILFVPVHFEAQYVLPAIFLFDIIGIIRGYSFVNLGHAAHLAGGLLGVAYLQFDGKTNIWKPLVRFWKRRLQRQS